MKAARTYGPLLLRRSSGSRQRGRWTSLLGRAGIYHRSHTVTQPATFTQFFAPVLGFCYPALVQGNQVVATLDTYKPGFNAGGGSEFHLGDAGLKAFAEARYHEMFTTHGTNLSYIPVTFGVRWKVRSNPRGGGQPVLRICSLLYGHDLGGEV